MLLDSMHKAKSLGTLRLNQNHKPRSPSMIGTIRIQDYHLKAFLDQFEDGDRQIIANLAAWKNTDEQGPFLTIELQPKWSSRQDNYKSILDLLPEDD